MRNADHEQLSLQLADQRITDQASQFASRIKDMADLETAARELQLTVQESGFFQREDPVPGLGAAPQVAAAAFTLQGTAASQPLGTTRGPVFIAVSERKDPYVPMLDEVKERVREDLIKAKATEAEQASAQLRLPPRSSQRRTSLPLQRRRVSRPRTPSWLPRGAAIPDIGVSPEVDRIAFSLPAGSVSDPIQTADGTVIVRVVNRDEVTPDELKQAQEAFRGGPAQRAPRRDSSPRIWARRRRR